MRTTGTSWAERSPGATSDIVSSSASWQATVPSTSTRRHAPVSPSSRKKSSAWTWRTSRPSGRRTCLIADPPSGAPPQPPLPLLADAAPAASSPRRRPLRYATRPRSPASQSEIPERPPSDIAIPFPPSVPPGVPPSMLRGAARCPRAVDHDAGSAPCAPAHQRATYRPATTSPGSRPGRARVGFVWGSGHAERRPRSPASRRGTARPRQAPSTISASSADQTTCSQACSDTA